MRCFQQTIQLRSFSSKNSWKSYFSKENTKIGEKIRLDFDSWTKAKAVGAFTSFPLDVRMGTTHMDNSMDPMVRWYVKVQIPLRTSIDIINNFRKGKPSY